jgi:hypothetical protein
MAQCNPDKIKLAVFEQTKLITDFSDIKIKNSDKFILNKVPDGGMVENDDNNDSIIYGWAEQAPVAYRSKEYANRPLVSGEMTGRQANTNLSAPFTVDINDTPDNACHGQTEIDFAQGFKRRGFEDRTFDAKTPVKCVNDLERFTRKQAQDYFDGMRTQFSNFGMENFAADLINMTILNGEANASIMSPNGINLTSGGWEAIPEYRISIFALQEYREEILATKKGLGQDVSEDWTLEIELPFQDWVDAVRQDQIQRNGASAQIQYPVALFEDTVGNLKSRKSHTYGGIKAFFNETPVRGYFKPKGDGSFAFIRVNQFINEAGEEGGLVMAKNDNYRRDTVVVGGISYPMITLIPHIDPTSFTRFGKKKALKPVGGENLNLNFDVRVIDGPYIDCNEMNDKFRLVARHGYRFRAKYPELSGWIAYRHSQQSGYVIAPITRGVVPAPIVDGFPDPYRQQDIDACTAAECEQCDQVVDSLTLQCIDPLNATPSVLALTPSGEVTSPTTTAAPTQVRLTVERTGGLGKVSTVGYATANGTATAGSDYTAASGTLTWEIGDNDPKFINVQLLAAATEAEKFTVTLSAPTNATIATSQGVATITIKKLS